MFTHIEDSNKIILERLSILLEKRNTYDIEFLNGISSGEIIERSHSRLISLPGMPEKWSNNNNEFEWEIRIHPDSYLARKNNKYFNEDFNNDFDDIKDEVNNLNKIPNKIISQVTVKPQVNDDSFLGVMGEIIKSRGIMRYGYFKSDFLDGFSKGIWKINKIEVPTIPNIPPLGMNSNQTSSTVTKNELVIEIPFDNYQHKIDDDFKNDDNYILKIAEEIKHFNENIYKVEVKSL